MNNEAMKKKTILKILFVIACIAVYPLLFLLADYIANNESHIAQPGGLGHGFGTIFYSIIFCVVFFVGSLFLSRHILGSALYAILFAWWGSGAYITAP